MGIATYLLAAAVTAAPHVDVTTLDGEEHRGELARLTATELTLRLGDDEQTVSLTQLMEVRLVREADAPADPKAARVLMVDGSRLACTAYATSAREATLEAAALGGFKLPLTAVGSVRFAPDDDARRVEEAWNGLLQRELRRDLLVVRKGDVLDHLEGTIGDIDARTVRFLIDGEEIPVRRDRVFGVIYARPQPRADRPVCELRLAGEGLVRLKAVAFDGQGFKATLLSGAQVELAADGLRSFDFSLGKVRYLSDMEPREVKYVPFFDDEADRHLMQFRRDRNGDGEPLRLGERTFNRGLWLHSKTTLRYRLNGEYRRFHAVAGIDYPMAQRGLGDVRLVISGDGRTLFESEVRGPDPPQPLELDVSGVRDLEILVDFNARGHYIGGDHLNLGDAKVVK